MPQSNSNTSLPSADLPLTILTTEGTAKAQKLNPSALRELPLAGANWNPSASAALSQLPKRLSYTYFAYTNNISTDCTNYYNYTRPFHFPGHIT